MKENFIFKGQCEDDLRKAQQQIAELTSIDSFLRPAQTVYEKKTYVGGKLVSIGMYTDIDDYADAEPYTKGKTYNRFVSELQAVKDSEVSLYLDSIKGKKTISVLSYAGKELARDFEGKIISHWILIDPACPYEVENYIPQFRTKTLHMSEEDEAMLEASNLAFMSSDGTIYAIGTTALPSIGRLLDCASQSEVYEDQLGVALQIANRLLTMNKVQLICRTLSGDSSLKLCVGMAGSRFTAISQKDFYNGIMDALSQRGFYDINSWEISNEKTVVDFRLENNVYNKGILVTTSDLSDTAMKVTAYAEVAGVKVFLLTNTKYHNAAYSPKMIEDLLKGVDDAFDEFESNIDVLASKNVQYDGKYLKDMRTIVGAKRAKGEKFPTVEKGIYNALALYESLMFRTALSSGQETKLHTLYGLILKDLVAAPSVTERSEKYA